MAALYKLVALREQSADDISDVVRKRMLKSEWQGVREIRMLLSLARLGPGGYDDYMSRVTTEASRKDFESTFHDKRAFKLFM